MKKIWKYLRNISPIVLLFFAVLFFTEESYKATSVVNFHANLFEKKETIILDAGHGGEDGGTVGINGTLEKDINLAIALKLRDILIENNFNVVMIRDGDYAVGDTSLSTIAERKRSDTKKRLETVMEQGECVYVSIHQNSFTESKYSGTQVFYSANREESALLAENIRKNVVADLQPDNTRQNKIAEKNIFILYHAEVPAVLVECGFLTNPSEADKLCRPDYQQNMAQSIYKGILSYFSELDTSKETDESLPGSERSSGL